MPYSKYLSISLISLVALAGCSSSTENSQSSTTVSGTTTLSKAIVCVDENRDNQCNDSETKVQANDEGNYTLKYSGKLAENSSLLAQDGHNLILEKQNLNLRLKAAYNSEDSTTDINTMSTLIANSIENGSSHSEAKNRIAQKYNLSLDIVDSDPIELLNDDSTQVLFLTTRAIENGVSNSSKFRADANATVITEGDADSALDGIDIFDFDLDAFINRLSEYFDYLKGIFSDYYCELTGSCDDFNISKDLDSAIVTREALNGVWYLELEGNAESCVEMDASNNYNLSQTMYEVDGTDINETFNFTFAYTETDNALQVTFDPETTFDYKVNNSKTIDNTMYFYFDGNSEFYTLSAYNSIETCKVDLAKAKKEAYEAEKAASETTTSN